MIKAKTTNGSLIFGLSAGNLERLKLGMPIEFNLEELELDNRHIAIVYGETEPAICEMMASMINPDKITILDIR